MPDEPKKKFLAASAPPPPVQQVQGPGWVIAQIGNKLSAQPPALLVGTMMCVPCFPKQVPSFHIFNGDSICADCLAGARGLKKKAEDGDGETTNPA